MNTTADFYLAMTRNVLGLAGELKVKEALEAQGFQVDTHPVKKFGDLRAISPQGEVFYIEVKTARQNSRKQWCFTLIKRKKTDCSHCDYVIMLAILKSGQAIPFVVPVGAIERLTAITLPKHPLEYAGIYAQYRQNIKELRLQ